MGRTTIIGDLVLDPTSITDIEIEGTDSGPPEFDIIDVTGTAELNGFLNVLLPGPFDPSPVDSFQIMTCGVTCLGGVLMKFATETPPAGKKMTVTYAAPDVVLSGIADTTTFIWTRGNNNDSWDDPLNWDAIAVPGPANEAFVPVVAALPVVIDTGNQQVAGLISNESITVTGLGVSLTVTGTASFNGALSVNSFGTANLDAASSVAGTLTVNGGTANLNAAATYSISSLDLSSSAVLSVTDAAHRSGYRHRLRF